MFEFVFVFDADGCTGTDTEVTLTSDERFRSVVDEAAVPTSEAARVCPPPASAVVNAECECVTVSERRRCVTGELATVAGAGTDPDTGSSGRREGRSGRSCGRGTEGDGAGEAEGDALTAGAAFCGELCTEGCERL